MAGGGRVSPRQKMINMMYLVLTAMLALNVSAEILKAFNLVNSSLMNSTRILDVTNGKAFDAFAAEEKKQGMAKVAPFRKAGEEVKKEADALFAYIAELKNELTIASGTEGKVKTPTMEDFHDEESFKEWQRSGAGRLKGEGNLEVPTHILVGVEGKNNGKGYELKKRIAAARAKMLSLVNGASAVAKFDETTFSIEDPKDPSKEETKGEGNTDWVRQRFGEVPTAAAVTLLSKYQADIRNGEAQILQHLLSQINAEDIKFDAVVAKVIAPTSYLLQGQKYTAEVLLAAYDSKKTLDIYVGGSKLPVKDGLGKYEVSASSPGVKKYAGYISLPDPKGGVKQLKFEGEYTVAAPAATISPDKMNVFYIGVPNPVSVSAAGVDNSKLQISMENGTGSATISGTNGKYTVTATRPGKVTIRVSGKVGDKTMALGAMEFRVKRIPDPIPQVGSLASGNQRSGTFKAQGGVVAILKDFDFEAKFSIISYKVFYIKKRQDPKQIDVTGASFGPAQSTVNGAGPGDTFVIDYIKARGPDGVVRPLPAITYTLN